MRATFTITALENGAQLTRQRQRARMVALVTALVVARLLDPASKLTTARLLDGTTATSSLGTVLALGKVDEQQLYDALDWLLAQQERIETELVRRHLSHGTLVLYDVSSTYLEGRTCELAKFGHNRDGKSGKLQIVIVHQGRLPSGDRGFRRLCRRSGNARQSGQKTQGAVCAGARAAISRGAGSIETMIGFSSGPGSSSKF
jgi:hypothetical protein